MWCKALRFAAILVLGAGQTATGASAFEHGSGWSSHFVHGHFNHHFRRKVLIVPYAWDWPYSDYGEAPTDAGNVGIILYPPPASAARAADTAPACHRNVETFTVPSADGGTREIKVISCP